MLHFNRYTVFFVWAGRGSYSAWMHVSDTQNPKADNDLNESLFFSKEWQKGSSHVVLCMCFPLTASQIKQSGQSIAGDRAACTATHIEQLSLS